VRTFQIAARVANLTVARNLCSRPAGPQRETITNRAFRIGGVAGVERRNAGRARALLDRVAYWRLARHRVCVSGGQISLGCPRLMLGPRFSCWTESRGRDLRPWFRLAILVRATRPAEAFRFGIAEHDIGSGRQTWLPRLLLADGRTLLSGTFAGVSADPEAAPPILGRVA